MGYGAPLPVREYANAAEMKQHMAEVRARLFAPRPEPVSRKPAVRFVPAGRDKYRGAELPRIAPVTVLVASAINDTMVADVNAAMPGSAAQRDGRADAGGQEILRIVSQVTGFELAALKSESRKQDVVRARQIAAWMLVRCAGKSLPDAGRYLGGRDHTTALHACRRVDATFANLGGVPDGSVEDLVGLLLSVAWPRGKSLDQAAS